MVTSDVDVHTGPLLSQEPEQQPVFALLGVGEQGISA